MGRERLNPPRALESVLSRIGIQDGMLMQTSLITW